MKYLYTTGVKVIQSDTMGARTHRYLVWDSCSIEQNKCSCYTDSLTGHNRLIRATIRPNSSSWLSIFEGLSSPRSKRSVGAGNSFPKVDMSKNLSMSLVLSRTRWWAKCDCRLKSISPEFENKRWSKWYLQVVFMHFISFYYLVKNKDIKRNNPPNRPKQGYLL